MEKIEKTILLILYKKRVFYINPINNCNNIKKLNNVNNDLSEQLPKYIQNFNFDSGIKDNNCNNRNNINNYINNMDEIKDINDINCTENNNIIYNNKDTEKLLNSQIFQCQKILKKADLEKFVQNAVNSYDFDKFNQLVELYKNQCPFYKNYICDFISTNNYENKKKTLKSFS